jgi:hypothetical protein
MQPVACLAVLVMVALLRDLQAGAGQRMLSQKLGDMFQQQQWQAPRLPPWRHMHNWQWRGASQHFHRWWHLLMVVLLVLTLL